MTEKIKNWGTLYCVGTGPGDPELLTLKALKILQKVGIVAVPRNAATGHQQAYEIVQSFLDESRQQIVPLDLPMVRDAVQVAIAWEKAITVILEILESGRDVALPVLGDPLLYGSFNYLLKTWAERNTGARLEIIPGVTSIQATTAAALFPLCETNERVAILPAMYADDLREVETALAEYDTVVLMKVGRALERLLPLLETQNRLQHTIYAERLGMPRQRLLRGQEIADLRGQDLPYFSLLITKRKG